MLKKIKNKFINKVKSNRGDSNSISQILWITLTVVLVLVVGGVIYNAVSKQASKASDCITNANIVFTGNSSNNCGTTTP